MSSALPRGYIERLGIQLKAVKSLLTMAEQAEQSAEPDGMNLPAEIASQRARLDVMAEAKVNARFEKEQAEYEAKLVRREAGTKKSGNKPGDKPPKSPIAGPKTQDQLNLTNEESNHASCRLLAAALNKTTTPRRWSTHRTC